MTLIDDWRVYLNRAWSNRFAIVGIAIAALDQILTAFQMFIPPWVYAVLMGLVIFARLVQQPKLAAKVDADTATAP